MRRAHIDEVALVKESLNAIEKGLYAKFLEDRELAVHEGHVLLASHEIFSLPEALREGPGGLPVGTISEEGFALDLQGALIMARETDRQRVRVNEKATRMFLYGKDVLGTSVLGWDRGLKRGDHCIVVNPRHEGLGIGQVIGAFKGSAAAVRSVHDLGTYLRARIHRDRGDEGSGAE